MAKDKKTMIDGKEYVWPINANFDMKEYLEAKGYTVPEGTVLPSLYEDGKVFIADSKIVDLSNYITKNEASFNNIVQIDYLLDNFNTKTAIKDMLAKFYTKLEIDTTLTKYYDKTYIDAMKVELQKLFATFDPNVYYTKLEIDKFIANIDKYTKAEINTMLTNIKNSVEASDLKIDDKIKMCVTVDVFNNALQQTVTHEELSQINNILNDEILTIKNLLTGYLTNAKYQDDMLQLREDLVAKETLVEYLTLENFNNVLSNYYSKSYMQSEYYNKINVNAILAGYITKAAINSTLTGYVNNTTYDANNKTVTDKIDAINNKFNSYYNRTYIDTLASTFATKNMLNETSTNIIDMFNNYYNKTEVDNKLIAVINDVNTIVGSHYTKTDLDNILTVYTTKTYVENKVALLAPKSTVYTKTEIDSMLTNIINDFNTKLDNYYKKNEIDVKVNDVYNKFNDYYLSTAIDTMLQDYVLKTDLITELSKYFTKTEVNNLFMNYYKKNEVDDKINNALLGLGLGALLDNYLLISDFNTRISNYDTTTIVDNKLSNLKSEVETYTDNKVSTSESNINTKITTLENKVNTNNSNVTSSISNINDDITDINTNLTTLDTKIDTKVNNITSSMTNDYYTKTEVNTITDKAYLKTDANVALTDLDNKINEVDVKVNAIDLSSYAKISLLNNNITTVNDTITTTKNDLNTKIDTVDSKFSDYPTALYVSSTYVTKNTFDAFKTLNTADITNINNQLTTLQTNTATISTDLNNYHLLTDFNNYKTTIYTKTEVDNIITSLNMYTKTDIDLKLNNINTTVTSNKTRLDDIDIKIADTYNKHETATLINNSANTLNASINTINNNLNNYLLISDFNLFKTNNTSTLNDLSARIDNNKTRLDNLSINYYTKIDADAAISNNNTTLYNYMNNNLVSNTNFNTFKGDVYTKVQINTLTGGYYNKTDVDTLINSVRTYTKTEIDDMTIAAKNEAVSTSKTYVDNELLNYSKTTDIQTLLNSYVTTTALNTAITNNNTHYYDTTTMDTFLADRPTQTQMLSQIGSSIIANNASYYKINEIDAKLLQLEDSIHHDNDAVYTKAQVDSMLTVYAKQIDVDLDITGLTNRVTIIETKISDMYNKSDVDTKISALALGTAVSVYTEAEVDTLLLAKLDTSSFNSFVNVVYTKLQIDNMMDAKVDLSDYNNDLSNIQNRLTDIEFAQPTYALKVDYYKTTEIDNKLIGLATETYVNNKVSNSITQNNLSYYDKNYIDTNLAKYVLKTALDTKLADYVLKTNFDNAISQFYNKTEIDTKLLKFNDIYTKTEVDTKLSAITASQVTLTDIDNKITLNNSDYYKKAEVNNLVLNYYSKTEVNDKITSEETRADNKYALRTDLNNYYDITAVNDKIVNYLPLSGGILTGGLNINSNLTVTGTSNIKTILADNISVNNFFNTSHFNDGVTEYNLLTVPAVTNFTGSKVEISNKLKVKDIDSSTVVIKDLFKLPNSVLTDSSSKISLLDFSNTELNLTDTRYNMTISHKDIANNMIYALQGDGTYTKSLLLGYINDLLYFRKYESSTWDRLALHSEISGSNTAIQTQINDIITNMGTKLNTTTFENYKTTTDAAILNNTHQINDNLDAITDLDTTLRNDLVSNTTFDNYKTSTNSQIANLNSSLSNYVTHSELTTFGTDVDNKINTVSNTVLADKTYFNNKFNNYYTKTQVDSLIAAVPTISNIADYAKLTDLATVDNKYKVVTDTTTINLNALKTNFDTFKADQLLDNTTSKTNFDNYATSNNTAVNNISTNLANNYYNKNDMDGKITTSETNINSTLTTNYYNKNDIDTKLSTLDLTAYALKNTVYTKTEVDNLFSTTYTKSYIDNLISLYYTKTQVDSLLSNERTSNDTKYVKVNDFNTYTSTVYTKTEVDTLVNNNSAQITTLGNTINTLSTRVNDNYDTLDASITSLTNTVNTNKTDINTKVDAFVTTTNNNFTTVNTDITDIKNNYAKTTDLQTAVSTITANDSNLVTTATFNTYKNTNDVALADINTNLTNNYTTKTYVTNAIAAADTVLYDFMANNYADLMDVDDKINYAMTDVAKKADVYTKTEVDNSVVKYSSMNGALYKITTGFDLGTLTSTSGTITTLNSTTGNIAKVVSSTSVAVGTGNGVLITPSGTTITNGYLSMVGSKIIFSTSASSKADFTVLTGNQQFRLPYTTTIRHSTTPYSVKTDIEDRSFIFSYNDKGGADTTQEAGFYLGFTTIDTPVNNGHQVAGLGLYTFTTDDPANPQLGYYVYTRANKTASYYRNKKTFVTSGNNTIDGATWNITSTLWMSGTGDIRINPSSDVYLQPGNDKALYLSSGVDIVNGITKINPKYGRTLILPRYDTTESTLKKDGEISYVFGWQTDSSSKFDKYAFFRNNAKNEIMHTFMNMGNNNQYGTTDADFYKYDTAEGTNGGFTILSDNSTKKVSVGQITKTASFAKMNWLDLVSTNDYKIGDKDNGFPLPHRDGYRRTPDGLMERWFYLNANIIKLIPLKPEEIVTDKSSPLYNIKYKSEIINNGGEGDNYSGTVMIVDLGFTFTQIYDIDILYNSNDYYGFTVVPENGILTEDGKLKLLLRDTFSVMVTDNNGVIDPNSNYINWILDALKKTKVRILGRTI